jgi:hypothetical protein
MLRQAQAGDALHLSETLFSFPHYLEKEKGHESSDPLLRVSLDRAIADAIAT